jgi:hypothetical protein
MTGNFLVKSHKRFFFPLISRTALRGLGLVDRESVSFVACRSICLYGPGPLEAQCIVDICTHMILYQSKDGKEQKTFDALEWLAAMCSHVPNKGEQMIRYYGYYSNVSRGKRKKQNRDESIPYILEPFESLQVERPDGSKVKISFPVMGI